jgi:hypothetical protein
MLSDLRVCLCVALARASGLVNAAFLRVPAAHCMEQPRCWSDEVGATTSTRLVPAGQTPTLRGRALPAAQPGSGKQSLVVLLGRVVDLSNRNAIPG